METVRVLIFENGLTGLLNRCDFDPQKHRIVEDEAAETAPTSPDFTIAEEAALPDISDLPVDEAVARVEAAGTVDELAALEVSEQAHRGGRRRVMKAIAERLAALAG